MANIRNAAPPDAAAIAAIYNQGIDDRGATFETTARTADDFRPRIGEGERFPILVAADNGAGIGEFSIYLDRSARGRGIGRSLLSALVDAARDRGYWKVVSRVFPFNAAS